MASAVGALLTQFLPVIRAAPFKITLIGDSTLLNGGGVQAELNNHLQMLYGSSAPVITNRGVAGTTIQTLVSNGQVAAAVADNPDLILIGVGVNNVTGATYAGILTAAATVLANIRTPLPNVPIAWWPLWCAHSEQWNPDPNAASAANVVQGVHDACVQANAIPIDVRTPYVVDETLNNPAQQTTGINTVDGTHPNWRGRPLCGRAIAAQMFYANPPNENIDLDPAWLPTVDYTPLVWLRADTLTGGPLTTWGPYTTFSGSPTVVPGGWNGNPPTGGLPNMPCVRFNGLNDCMVAGSQSIAAGAKTLFFVYRMNSVPTGFGTFVSALTFANGTVSSEFIPAFAGGTDPLLVWCCDQKASGADGFFEIGTSDITDTGNLLMPIRFSSTFAGGSSTAAANYAMFWGGVPTAIVQGTTFLAQATTCLNALGARVANAINPTNFAQIDIAEMILASGALSTLQQARTCMYLRRKWGP